MTTDLTLLQTRVRAVMLDASGLLWPLDTLTEGIRVALGEYNLILPQPATLAGLDGAAETSLNPLHEAMLVWGAAGFVALAGAADRGGYQIGLSPADLRAWGDQRLAEFRRHLALAAEAARLKALHTSSAAPWSTWAEEI